MLLVELDDAAHARRKLLHHGAVAGLDAAHDLRLIERAAVGERGVRQRELQHGDACVAPCPIAASSVKPPRNAPL